MHYDYHTNWAITLLVPFLLNYLAGWLAWYRFDKTKKSSWLACLLNFYPQMRAAKVIREIWRDSKKALVKKKKMEAEVSLAEVFLEAVPTYFVLIYLSFQGTNLSAGAVTRSQTRVRRTKGGYMFVFAICTSLVTASLGMAKSLKIGVCKILPDKGPLDGLLTVRFILLVIACFLTLVGKAFAFVFFWNVFPFSASFFLFTFPGLVTGLVFIRHRAILKTFLNQPSLLLLPVFTFFSFSSNTKSCCKREPGSQNDTEITFSVKATIVNIIVFNLVPILIFSIVPDPMFVLMFGGSLLTIVFLCTLRSCYCCPLDYGVYLPSSPYKVFVKDENEPNGRREIKIGGES